MGNPISLIIESIAMAGQRVRSLQFPDRFSPFSVVIVRLPVLHIALLITKTLGMPALINLFPKWRKKPTNIRWLESWDSFTVLYATLIIMVRNKLTNLIYRLSICNHVSQLDYEVQFFLSRLGYFQERQRFVMLSSINSHRPTNRIVGVCVEIWNFVFPSALLCPLTFKVFSTTASYNSN